MPPTMTEKRFAEIVAAYGTDPCRWPEDERAAAQAFANGNPAARARLEEDAWLGTVLDSYRLIEIEDRAGATVALPHRLPPQNRPLGSRLRFLFGSPQTGSILWPQLATLAMAMLIGASIGWNDPGSWIAEPSTSDMMALVSDASLSEEWMP